MSVNVTSLNFKYKYTTTDKIHKKSLFTLKFKKLFKKKT